MAKNTFMIRGSVTTAGDDSFAQAEIDLGSYTNLGSSKPEVLRIHRAHVYITDTGGRPATMNGDKAGDLCWQLTTQSQSALVLATDDSFVFGGNAAVRNPDSETFAPSQAFEQLILPQDYVAGAVIAVPTLFVGALSGTQFDESVVFSVILECTTEAMSKANAVSLAISQQ